MRIIDKNTDFYDYFQGIYRDDSIVFDRTDSFVVSKKMICEKLHKSPEFLLLQVCNTFWVFFIEVTKRDNWNQPSDYKIEYLGTWHNYSISRKLIQFNVITLGFGLKMKISNYENFKRGFVYDIQKILANKTDIIKAINIGDYRIEHNLTIGKVQSGDGLWHDKHIPILKECGIVKYINPQDIYLAFEEYFLSEKSSSERTESVGITDKEKIENHGFDTKTSFRKM